MLKSLFGFALLLWIVSLVWASGGSPPEPPARAQLDLGSLVEASSDSADQCRLSLNGFWEFCPSQTREEIPNRTDWGMIQVPGRWDESPMAFGGFKVWNEKREEVTSWDGVPLANFGVGWYRLELTVPAGWEGRQLRLVVDHIGFGYNDEIGFYTDGKIPDEILRSHGRVFWNGQEVKMEEDREVQLPSNTQWGGKNILLIAVQSGHVAPYWGRGINGDVWLEVVPEVWVQRVWTSMEDSGTSCEVEVRNDSEASRTILVSGELTGVGDLSSSTVNMEAHSTKIVSLGVSASTPVPVWSPSHPSRVPLVVTLEEGGQKEAVEHRLVGFARMRVKGPDILLNGLKTHFLTESGPDGGRGIGGYDGDFMRSFFQAYKAANYNSFRVCWGEAPNVFYDLTDELGLMVQQVLPSPHMAAMRLGLTGGYNDEFWKLYRALIARLIARTRGHPSVVAYDLWSHETTDLLQNQPRYLDGVWKTNFPKPEIPTDLQASQVIRELDPTREVFFDESGNLGAEVVVHPYFDFSIPLQEWEDWPEIWAQKKIKPLMAAEFSVPYSPSWCEWDAKTWANEGASTFFLEHAARYLGDRAYTASAASMVPEEWLGTGEAYHPGTPLDPTLISTEGEAKWLNLNPAVGEVTAMIAQRVYRAWRTYGVDLGPYNHDTLIGSSMLFQGVVYPRVPLSYETVQSPGPKPDFLEHSVMDLNYGVLPFALRAIAGEEPKIRPTRLYEVTRQTFAPLMAYIGGGEAEGITGKDHAFFVGEKFSKSLVVINDTETEVKVDLAWQWRKKGSSKVEQSGHTSLTVDQGARLLSPLTVLVPKVGQKTDYELVFSASKEGVVFSTDQMDIQIHPPLIPWNGSTPRLALYDPIGRTQHLLEQAGLPYRKVTAGAGDSWQGTDLLIIGAQCLRPEADFLAGALDKGVNILLFEQNVGALSEWAAFMGDRFSTTHQPELSTREVFISAPDHPILYGLSAEDFLNWRGSSDFVPSDPPANYAAYAYALGGAAPFKGSNRGVVSTWLVPKPQFGNARIILSAGFDMSLSPLLEFLQPKARVIWCQLDVTPRYGTDPVATRLVNQMICYASTPMVSWKKTYYVGDEVGLESLQQLHVAFKPLTSNEQLAEAEVLMVGPGAANICPKLAMELRSWVEHGGQLILLPGAYAEWATTLFSSPVKLETTEVRKCLPPERTGVFAGLSGGDFYFRQKLLLNTLTEADAEQWNLSKPGVVGSVKIGQGQVTVLQVSLTDLPNAPVSEPVVGKIRRIFTTVLTNEGVRLDEPFQLCPEVLDLHGTWSFHSDPGEQGEVQGWARSDFTETDWPTIQTPGLWEFAEGLGSKTLGYRGSIWYRRFINLPPSWQGKPVALHIGGIRMAYKLFLNGRQISESPPGIDFTSQSMEVPVPSELWKADGPNLFSIKVTDGAWGAGLTGPLYLYLNQDWLYRSGSVHYGIKYPNYDPEAYHYW